MIKNIINKLKNNKFIFCILLILNTFIVFNHFVNKQSFHVDEQWSYAHANSSQGAFLDKEIDSYYKINDKAKQRLLEQNLNSSIYHNYLTVQKNEAFEYDNIYKNLTQDVHPPLYMILIHTISSFFTDGFSKWYAGSINLSVFVLIYIMLFKLAKLILKDEKLALCTVALWGVSKIGIDMAIFLRMYAVQTLCGICLIYQTLKILEKNCATKKELFLVFLYSFLGIFTQYSSIFFSFFVTAVTCIILLKRKQYKIMFLYGFVMFLSVCMLFILFPQVYDILLNSQRANETLSRMQINGTILGYLLLFERKIITFIRIILSELFMIENINFLVVTFIIIMSLFVIFYFKIKFQQTTVYLISIVLLYSIYLSYMPPMGSFHNRYYMMIAPYMAILSILYVNYILNFMKIKKNYKIIILFVFIFVNSMCYDYKSKSAYAFTLTKEEVQILNKIKNKKVFLDAREVCGTKVYFRGEEYAEENRVMVGWIHSLACILKDANEIFISNDICSEASLQQIIDGDFSIIMTPLTWGRKNMESLKRDCFEKLGFTQKYKFCASEFCNYLYERK